jgi:thiamine monophosphate kinase
MGWNWGSAIWDHDLVPRVIAATGAQGDTRARLELVSSWEGVCHYVSQSRSTQQAQERALEITERIQEVIRLAVEFELVAMDLSA